MPKYKNISGVELTLPGIGIVKPDGEIEVKEGLNNANFQLVAESKKEEKIKPKEE